MVNKMRKITYLGYVLIICFVLISCRDNPLRDDNGNGGGPEPPILPRYFDYPAWHPEGTWIAADHYDSLDTDGDGRNDDYFGGIWLVHAETGTTQPLIRGYGNPAWSSDGTHLAMEAWGHIFTIEVTSLEPVEVDTNTLLQLTFDGRNFFPDWSPDGQWITYARSVCEGDSTCGVWIISSDGEEDNFIDTYGMFPFWHPFRKEILYVKRAVKVSGEILGDSLWVFNMETNEKIFFTFLEEENHRNQYPKYSPDGSKIAFSSQSRVGPSAIWVMSNDGSNLQKASPDYAWQFDWSPDGRKLVFLYWDFLNDRPGNGELWVVNIDGSEPRQLTHFKP